MGKKKTKEEFVEKAKIVHKDKYTYDKFNYKGAHIKSIIICPIHGDFKQTPDKHLRGQGCSKCAGNSKSNLEEFIQKAKIIHIDKYSYDKFVYINSYTKGIITCKKHGDFEQTPSDHLQGRGCPKCAGTSKSNLKEFVQKAKIVHKDSLYEYIYDKFVYVNNHTKSTITCEKHGDFEQRPNDHLNGSGCPECKKEKQSVRQTKTLEEFVEKAKIVHKDSKCKYYYDNFVYINSNTKGDITCEKHGDFEQTPTSHLNGNGCPECWKEKLGNLKRSNLEEFVEKANKIHHIKYDYSKFIYINTRKKGIIICPEHGEFEQTPFDHLRGCGCPKCANEKTVKRNRILNRIKWSNRFSEGILYLIECWNDFERFVKIGVTSRSVEERYRYDMPYNYSILKEIQTDSNTVSNTERYIIDFYNSYKPSIPFAGDSECLSIDEKFQIIEYLENLEKDLENS